MNIFYSEKIVGMWYMGLWDSKNDTTDIGDIDMIAYVKDRSKIKCLLKLLKELHSEGKLKEIFKVRKFRIYED